VRAILNRMQRLWAGICFVVSLLMMAPLVAVVALAWRSVAFVYQPGALITVALIAIMGGFGAAHSCRRLFGGRLGSS
jgi:hypothetical protein